jgi:ferredoxin-nitrite reductase
MEMKMRAGNNSIETCKAIKEGDGLRIREDLPRVVEQGYEALTPEQKQLLKWVGVFFREPTPGRFMMRIRMPNGFTNSRQLRAIADVSRQLGNQVLDITTRQQVELRGFAIENVQTIWEKLRQVDLHSLQTGMDNVRNINGCPLAGLTPNELLDASPVVFELEKTIVGKDGNPEFTNLPRKFNVTVTGCLDNCTLNESQDIALVPARIGERMGFNILVGGKMGSGGFTPASSLNVFVEAHEAARIVAELVKIYRDYGPREVRTRCRLAFLIEEWGIDRLRQELGVRLGRTLVPGGQDLRRPGQSDHLGIASQKQPELVSAGLCVPAGRMNSAQIEELAYLSDTYGNGQVRCTTGQNVILVNVPRQRVDALCKEHLLRQFTPSPSPFFRKLVACTGADYCNLALIETKQRAVELSQALDRRLGKDFAAMTIHWSGCTAGCGNHQAADLGLRGCRTNIAGKPVDAVAIYIGGRSGPNAVAGEQILDTVPCDDALPAVVAGILQQQALIRNGRRRPVVRTTSGLQPKSLSRKQPSQAARCPGDGGGKQFDRTSTVTRTIQAKLCRLDELTPGVGRKVNVTNRALAVFLVDGEVIALEAECPHEGGPIDEGTIERGRVVCPWHGYGFELQTGECDFDHSLKIGRYQTFIKQGEVWVDLREQASPPAKDQK